MLRMVRRKKTINTFSCIKKIGMEIVFYLKNELGIGCRAPIKLHTNVQKCDISRIGSQMIQPGLMSAGLVSTVDVSGTVDPESMVYFGKLPL